MHEIYDYVTSKPELDENLLMHYGIKGMKWKKRLKGLYYSSKSKIKEAKTKINRKKLGINDPSEITYFNGKRSFKEKDSGKGPSRKIRTTYDRNWTWTFNKGHDQPGIVEGRKRAAKKKKK